MRKLSAIFAALVLAFGFILAASGNASATDGPWLGCRISPGTVFTWNQFCDTSEWASTYYVGFSVQNPPAGATYSWSVPTAYQSRIYTGCGTSDSSCGVTATGNNADIIVSVNIYYGGTTTTSSAWATMDSWACGGMEC